MRLDNIIIHPDIILNSVQAAVEESINSKSFVDLSMHLPERLLTNSTLSDLHLILKQVVHKLISFYGICEFYIN